jgi:hypothetical protein
VSRDESIEAVILDGQRGGPAVLGEDVGMVAAGRQRFGQGAF